ncbi:MAG: SDR family NAD(P)-dependent oxidoreductase [Candidatus Binatia bacterium]
MGLPLSGRTAWVTGAASGIGRAIACELKEWGASVALLDLDARGARQVASEIGGVGIRCDVAVEQSVARAARKLERQAGMADILVNAAGISHAEPVATHGTASWRRELDVNLNGPFFMTRAVLGGMMARGYGRIVNIASSSAVRVGLGVAAYGSAKAGLIALTKAVANEAAAHGVTVNAVAPGLVDTAMMRRMFHTTEALEALASNSPLANPMGKLLQPEDIAHAVAFLCHPRSWSITGQVLHVNAGALMP